MKLKKSSFALSILAVATMTSPLALAADVSDWNSGWYLGGNVGQSRAHVDAQKIANDVTGGFPSTYLDHNTIDSGFKLYGGYQFNQYVSIEGGYFDLGEAQFHHLTTPDGLLTNNMKVRGVNLDVVGYLPFTEKFSAFARIGANYALTQDTFTGTGAAAALGGKLSDRATFGKAGVGLEYKFTDALAMRIESERYRVTNALTDHNEIDLFSVGVVYRFGAHKKPMPVAATPAPVAAPAPAPRFEKVTISATELFKFDSAEVSQAQPDLEKLTTTLKDSTEPKRVNIVGYTDRLGSGDYNQKLSERRAEAVKSYMVTKGIEADRLATEGRGEKDPVVECNDKNREKLIECLQPNRRVQIDQIEVEKRVQP